MSKSTKKLRNKLNEICEQSDTSKKGMEMLVDYYINSLGWSEDKALIYAIGLFHDGTISAIKFFGKDGKEI